jgi:hypothetical protein
MEVCNYVIMSTYAKDSADKAFFFPFPMSRCSTALRFVGMESPYPQNYGKTHHRCALTGEAAHS